ncbi:Hk [Drosophila busckii]|uniref:Hk n=1 Tax=Drosophila busckii TaxID=30019 RepID=A0A0M3QYU4_DROBS|nr:Hk [Drosophila busckii]
MPGAVPVSFTVSEAPPTSGADTMLMPLPGALNFVMGATVSSAATASASVAANDNNNNNDNASDDSNPVTIYRCRAPIASLDCMEEFSGRSISLGSNPALQLRHGSTPTPGLRYKNLGKSGLRISNVGLGTWPVFSPGVSDEQAESILKLAIDSGINLFDISEAHSETEIGKILQRTGWKRTTYVITTKVYWSTKSEERGLSRKHIIECVRASLQRLQLSYIDIVIIHKADPMCPMEEVVRAMSYVIQQGWAMYWGTARWSQVEIMEAYTNCRQFNCITPIVEQSEYHMFCREKCELYLPEMYNKIGVGLMAWGPLSMALSDTQNGDKLFLPKGSFKTKSFSWTEDEINRNAALSPQGSWGKDRIEEGRRHCDRLRDLAALAEKLGCSPTQLSIAWSLKHEPVQCLLLGATSAEQLHQSLQSLQSLDFHIKSLYSGLRPNHKSASSSIQDNSLATVPRPAPDLRIESVDAAAPSDLLLDYTQSPYTPRRNSSTQLLPLNNLSPYFLSPYAASASAAGAGAAAAGAAAAAGDGIRRSSTSDIVGCRRRGSSASNSNSRRPSTTDLLRRARERRGSEARMGRSVSHSGMRGGSMLGGGAGCMGGRRTSMAARLKLSHITKDTGLQFNAAINYQPGRSINSLFSAFSWASPWLRQLHQSLQLLQHEPVQCFLLGATSAEQLHQSLQSLQLLQGLSTSVLLELERILESKPVRPLPPLRLSSPSSSDSPKYKEEAFIEVTDTNQAANLSFCDIREISLRIAKL